MLTHHWDGCTVSPDGTIHCIFGCPCLDPTLNPKDKEIADKLHEFEEQP